MLRPGKGLIRCMNVVGLRYQLRMHQHDALEMVHDYLAQGGTVWS